MQASTHKAGDARAGQVFAYGQTGSGKTYTMGTAATFRQMSSGEEGDGIIPRSVRYIFDSLTAVQDAYDISIKVRALLCTPGRSHHLCMCAGAAYGVHAPAKTHTADMVDADAPYAVSNSIWSACYAQPEVSSMLLLLGNGPGGMRAAGLCGCGR